MNCIHTFLNNVMHTDQEVLDPFNSSGLVYFPWQKNLKSNFMSEPKDFLSFLHSRIPFLFLLRLIQGLELLNQFNSEFETSNFTD